MSFQPVLRVLGVSLVLSGARIVAAYLLKCDAKRIFKLEAFLTLPAVLTLLYYFRAFEDVIYLLGIALYNSESMADLLICVNKLKTQIRHIKGSSLNLIAEVNSEKVGVILIAPLLIKEARRSYLDQLIKVFPNVKIV